MAVDSVEVLLAVRMLSVASKSEQNSLRKVRRSGRHMCTDLGGEGTEGLGPPAEAENRHQNNSHGTAAYATSFALIHSRLKAFKPQ